MYSLMVFGVCVCLERKEIRERMMMVMWRRVKVWNRDENKQNESQNRDEEEINTMNSATISGNHSIHSFLPSFIHSFLPSFIQTNNH